MSYLPGMGDPDAYEAAAGECERVAGQLDASLTGMRSLRSNVHGAWSGNAGDSLASAVQARAKTAQQVQADLRHTAAKLRAAAADVRAAMKQQQMQQQKQQQPAPLKS
jgi:WXG100 family type VII secretion target